MQGKNPRSTRSASGHRLGRRIQLQSAKVAEFCRRHHIRRLSLFGSVLRDDFGSDSDVDILVEFDASHVPGLIRLAGMELELSELLDGRKADMNTARGLGRYIRDEVLREAIMIYGNE